MKASLFKLLLQQAMQFRRSQGAMWLTYLIWLTVLVVMLLALWMANVVENPRGLQVMCVVCLCLLVYTVWPPLTKVIPLLLTPANAQLVPGLRRAAMWVVGVVFAFVLVVGTLIIGMPNGIVIKCASLISLALAGLSLINLGRMVGTVPYFGAILMTMGSTGTGLSLPVLSGAAILTSMYAFACLFPRGEGHWRSMGKLDKIHRAASGQLPAAGAGPLGVRRIVYGLLLARDSRHANAPGTMLWHVLGPNAHWSTPALALLLLLVLCGLTIGLVSAMGWSGQFVQGLAAGVLMAVGVFGQLLYVQQIAMRLNATRAEQQLLRMTASMPQNGALTQLFVRQVLLHSAAMFAGALLLSVVASLMLEASLASVLTGLSLASLTALLSGGTLRWITKKGNPTNIWPAVLALLQMAAVGLVFMWINVSRPLPLPLLAVPSILLAAAFLVRDVRKTMRGPAILALAT